MKHTNRFGFTLVELITVILLLGILSAVTLPRFFNQSTFSSFYQKVEFENALTWTRNKTLTSQCAHEIRISSNGWMVLRDDDRDGNSTDNDCSSNSNPGDGCSGSAFLSFVYRNDNDIVTDSSQTALSGSHITSSSTHRLIFTTHGQLYDLSTLPIDLTTGCTDLSGQTPISNNATITLDQIGLTADGETSYVAVQ
jgi:MSHA pilin protein MshC